MDRAGPANTSGISKEGTTKTHSEEQACLTPGTYLGPSKFVKWVYRSITSRDKLPAHLAFARMATWYSVGMVPFPPALDSQAGVKTCIRFRVQRL
jgi:hypothetical protein